jgi:small subunit ribosomal protein S1
MSWGRINHPSEMLKIDQEIEVKVLNIDREKEKIALGLKQKEPSPWEEIERSTRSARASRARWSTSCPTAPS